MLVFLETPKCASNVSVRALELMDTKQRRRNPRVTQILVIAPTVYASCAERRLIKERIFVLWVTIFQRSSISLRRVTYQHVP